MKRQDNTSLPSNLLIEVADPVLTSTLYRCELYVRLMSGLTMNDTDATYMLPSR